MRKVYEYEIRYCIIDEDGNLNRIQECGLYSKRSAVKRYIEILDSNMRLSSLQFIRNGVDKTTQVNKFLYH